MFDFVESNVKNGQLQIRIFLKTDKKNYKLKKNRKESRKIRWLF